ncbi:MAG TPA: DUF5318 family protein, partial [Streptosporangiaceae bacterium]
MYRADTSRRYVGWSYHASSDEDRGSAPAPFRRTLSLMRRSVVDYGLARRATLASVFAGRMTTTDVCDAHPYLLRAAKFHGEPTTKPCP